MHLNRYFLFLTVLLVTLFFVSCGDTPKENADTGDTADSVDTGNSADTADTADTANTSDTGNTTDTGNSADTGDTADTGNSGDTANTADTSDTGDTVEDLCPDDPEKIDPGVCGCDVPEIDSDSDGVCDASVYRITELTLLDPHLKISLTGLGIDCIDETSAVNDELVKTMTETTDDTPPQFKTNILIAFRPLYQKGTSELPADVYTDAVCTSDLPWECTPGENDPELGTYTNLNGGAEPCLGPLAGTTNYEGINTPLQSCFVSTGMEVIFPIDEFDIVLTNTQIAAHYDNDPAGALHYGLMRGFVAEESIKDVIIPEDTPIIGGRKLTTILPGGAGCPCGDSEADYPDGVKGWWFYLNYIAVKVDFTEPTE